MNKTYEIVKPPEPAMPWPEYKHRISTDWKSLLESDECDEIKFQSFLENHPCFLPCVHGAFNEGHHGLFPNAVISQPVLTGLATKIPDFLMIANDSECIYALLIEIESPCKSWFTKTGQQRAELTQAINQLKEWQLWFSDPLNVAQFMDEYKIPDKMKRIRIFEQKYILIYGRRDEVISSGHNKKRAKLEGKNEIYMTYDRLFPDERLSNDLCAKIDGKGYKAISVPPTFRFYPWDAKDLSLIRGKEEAAQNNNIISEKRKKFLVDRWQYWDKWASSKEYGVVFDPKDYE